MSSEAQVQIADVLEQETYEEFMARLDLYNKIAAGLRDVQEGRTCPAVEALARIRAGIRG